MAGQGPSDDDSDLTVSVGPLGVDWPRSAGYFGGVGLAVAAGMIDPPLAVFIAVIPFAKMLARSEMPRGVRFFGQLFEGAAKPVGGDGEGTIWIDDTRPIRRAMPGVSTQPPGRGTGRSGARKASRPRARAGNTVG